MSLTVRDFPSLDALVAQGDQPESAGGDSFRRGRESRSGSRMFTETESWTEAMQVARDGYRDVRAEIRGHVVDLEHVIRAIEADTWAWRHDVTGVAVDVDRYLSGEPENMLDSVPVTVPTFGRVVRVLVNGAASSRVEAETIRKRGAAIVALVEAVELAGCSAEVLVTFPVSDRETGRKSSFYAATVTAKAADQALDLDALAFLLAHPSMLRRCVFAVEETEGRKVRDQFGFYPGGGYGLPATLDIKREPFNMAKGLVDRYAPQVIVDLPDLTKDLNRDPAKWLTDTLRGLELVD